MSRICLEDLLWIAPLPPVPPCPGVHYWMFDVSKAVLRPRQRNRFKVTIFIVLGLLIYRCVSCYFFVQAMSSTCEDKLKQTRGGVLRRSHSLDGVATHRLSKAILSWGTEERNSRQVAMSARNQGVFLSLFHDTRASWRFEPCLVPVGARAGRVPYQLCYSAPACDFKHLDSAFTPSPWLRFTTVHSTRSLVFLPRLVCGFSLLSRLSRHFYFRLLHRVIRNVSETLLLSGKKIGKRLNIRNYFLFIYADYWMPCENWNGRILENFPMEMSVKSFKKV